MLIKKSIFLFIYFIYLFIKNVISDDLEILNNLYNELDGDNWINKSNWNNNDVCIYFYCSRL